MSTRHITVRTDRRLIRSGGRSERFLLVELVAPTVPRDPNRKRPPVNLAFVVDRSGSMAGRNKLSLAKQAVEEALARLDENDRFSVVVYDERVEIPSPSAPASGAARAEASRALVGVDPRGSTDLGNGWLTGCGQVADALLADGINRCLLLTDGLANVGMTDPGELAHHAGELRARGVATTTFGVGEDFDESLLQAMADAGGGHFYFIGSVPEIRDHITGEVGEALEVVARDVILEVTAPETVQVEPMTPFRVERRASRTLIHLGDLVSGQVLRLVLRLTFPYGEAGREIGALVGVRDRDGAFSAAEPELAPVAMAWAWADHAANDAQPRDGEVDRAVAEIFAARARQEAVRLNRAGDFAGASVALKGVARRVRSYAGRDATLREIAVGLETEATVAAAPMAEMSRKQMHYSSANLMRSRSADGKARRQDDPSDQAR
jgi:Ca-activated chloride channel family protein